jgi:hypothetical protein
MQGWEAPTPPTHAIPWLFASQNRLATEGGRSPEGPWPVTGLRSYRASFDVEVSPYQLDQAKFPTFREAGVLREA